MNDMLRKLIELQAIDADILALQRKRKEIPEALRKEQAEYEHAVADLRKTRESRKETEVECEKSRLGIDSAAEQIKNLEGKQSQVKRNQEYQALTREIRAAKENKKRHTGCLEEQIAAMEESDGRMAENEQHVAEKRAAILQSAEEAKKALLENQRKIGKYKLLRRDLAAEIKPEHLSRYNELFRSRAPRVLVKADKGVCGGCNINLPAQVIADIMKPDDRLVFCENCARILYIEGEIGE